MKRSPVISVPTLVALSMATAMGHAGSLDQIMTLQKNGMWEMRPPGYTGEPYLFCVTDTTKMGGLQETAQAVKGLGCKVVRDLLTGDVYEIEMDCSSPDPNIGNFRMLMQGTARTDYQAGTTTIIGGGALVQALFPSGKDGGGESRWLRPCRADEKPGLQKAAD